MNGAHTIWTAASRQSVLDGLAGASSLRILVLGDLMVDQYLLGKVDRISPEAPVPVLNASERDRRPGGAANVALNRRAPEVRVILPDRSLLRLRIKTNLYAAAESRNASVSSAGSCARGVLATMHTLS